MSIDDLIINATGELHRWRADNPGPDVEPEEAINEIATGFFPIFPDGFQEFVEDDVRLLTMVPDEIDALGDQFSAADVIRQVLLETLENALWDEWEEMLEEERWQRLENRRQR